MVKGKSASNFLLKCSCPVMSTFALEKLWTRSYSLITFLSMCILIELLQSLCIIFYCVDQYVCTRDITVKLVHKFLASLRNIPSTNEDR